MAQAPDKRPEYTCVKRVRAHKIAGIRMWPDGGAMLHPAEPGFAQLKFSKPFLDRHEPAVGGYIVYYEDGYISYSPAKAFEEGYVKT